MRGERACDLWAVDYVRKEGISRAGSRWFDSNQGSGTLDLGRSLGMALFRLVPAGWFDQNKLSLCRLHEEYLLPVVDLRTAVSSRPPPPAGRVSPRNADAGGLTTSSRSMLLPALGRVGRRGSPAPKPPLTSPASPARWSATGWRTASSRRRSKRWRRSSSRSCRTTSSTASRSNTAAPTTASLCSTRSGGTKPTTAAKSD